MRYLRPLAIGIGLTGFFLVLGYFYLYPGSALMLEGDRGYFLSDGTDSTTQSYQFGLTHRNFDQDPTLLLYGAMPSKSFGAPEGSAIWNTWIERWFAVAARPFMALDQIPTALSLFYLLASALAMTALGRVGFRWHWAISIGLAIAWAFSAYTRARAKVHIGFVALYHLPLLFLALTILHRGNTWRSIAAAAVLFLGVSTAPHYYIIMTTFFGVFALAFYFLFEKQNFAGLTRLTRRLAIAIVPALLFNLYCILMPIPVDMRDEIANTFPNTGVAETWPHPFLEIFAAHPLDYFTGDTGISTEDLNPLREALNIYNFEKTPVGNAHERTNGVRWSIWIILALAALARVKRRIESGDADYDPAFNVRIIWIFGAMALTAFLLSLPPSYFGGKSPSLAIHAIVPQFRISSRAGIFVGFSLLMMTGIILTKWRLANPKRNALIWLFPLLMIVDLPPVYNPMPIAAILPAYDRLKDLDIDSCGLGMSFPYSSGTYAMMDFYQVLQKLRGSGCGLVNAAAAGSRDQAMIQHFALTNQTATAIASVDRSYIQYLVTKAQCIGLRFLIFDPRLPTRWQSETCQQFEGVLDSQGLCMKAAIPPQLRQIDACLL